MDSKYRFLAVEAAGYGKQSDGGMFASSTLKKLLEKCISQLPPPQRMPLTDQMAPMVILADRAYPLEPYLMKPYVGEYSTLTQPQRQFNGRHASARRVVENAFGQVVAQFHVFQSAIDMDDWKYDIIIMVAFLLHNLMIDKEDRAYQVMSKNFQEQIWQRSHIIDELHRQNLPCLDPPSTATNIRQLFTDFFVNFTNN